jgi:hypothetical protein
MRKWNLPLTYEPKIEAVRAGTCKQTIRVLTDHPCKCEGKDLGRWKHGESQHHSSGSPKICPRCHGTGIIKAVPKKVGDLIAFHGWAGVPYQSPWSWRMSYTPLKEVANISIREWGILWKDGAGGYSYWSNLSPLAYMDGIVPSTGEALRDVLVSKNRIPDTGIEAQILRW